MIARLILFLLLYTTPVGAVGYIVYRKIFRPRLESARNEKQAQLNAVRVCFDPYCTKLIDICSPDTLMIGPRTFAHRECYQKLLTEK